MLLEGVFKYRQVRLEVIGESHKIVVLMSLERNLTLLEPDIIKYCLNY